VEKGGIRACSPISRTGEITIIMSYANIVRGRERGRD